MPRPATQTRHARATERETQLAAAEMTSAGALTRLGSGLLFRLARLANASDDDRPDSSRLVGGPRRDRPNRCEFDYDYYVALQSRRRHQPSRPHRAETADIGQ